MSTKTLILPEIKRMLQESRKRQGITYLDWYEEGFQDALCEVEELFLGMYPEQEERREQHQAV